jgi:hypothetical protein
MRGADDHSSHSINEDEKIEYIDYINSKLASDPDVGGRLPIPSDTMQVFEECRDGLIICKLIEHIFPGTVHGVMSRNAGVSRKSARAYLNFPTPDRPLNKFKIAENNNVAVRAAEAIGANVVNISGQDLAEGREHLILSLLGQIIRLAASGRPRPSPRPFPTFPSPKMVQRVNRVPSPISSEKSIPPLSLDDDEPTRVPNTPTSFVMRRDTTPTRDRGRDYSVDYSRDHDRDHDRDQIAELGLRSKLLKRGTFNLFEDVKVCTFYCSAHLGLADEIAIFNSRLILLFIYREVLSFYKLLKRSPLQEKGKPGSQANIPAGPTPNEMYRQHPPGGILYGPFHQLYRLDIAYDPPHQLDRCDMA